MNSFLVKKQRGISIVATILGLLFTGWYIFDLYTTAVKNAIDKSDIWYTMSSLVFVSPLFLPAFLGLFFYVKKNRRKNKWVGLSYIVYFLILLLSFYWLSQPSDDPLETGLPMILIALPVCLAVSVSLLIPVFQKQS